MLRISSFSEDRARDFQAALRDFERPQEGLEAKALLMPDGWYAMFGWPDWPKPEAEKKADQIEQFHHAHPDLQPIPPRSEKWISILHGCQPDYESAEAIANSFNKHFNGAVRWVESERDPKGRIAAECLVEGAGDFHIELSWRDCLILPLRVLKDDDLRAFKLASQEVIEWAGRRIQPIVDTLKQKLQELYGDRFRGLYIFGSYARPDAGIELPIDSDLDVALLLTDFKSPYDEIKRYGHITAELSLQHDIVISLIPIREADYRGGKTNFTREISEYAIPV
ncbi:MAG TPA: nucleotidyltransferase domain-containing protein [Terriglobia bacterium]|nr:nucleotidyltransferase domain-containing protein [Terriglobia bacterium]